MKKILSICVISMLLLSFSTIVYADDTTTTAEDLLVTEDVSIEEDSADTTTEEILNNDPLKQENDIDDLIDGGVVSDVNFEDVVSKVENKMYEVIGALQVWAQPGSVFAFIVGLILVIFGAMGNHSLMGKGFIVMIVSVLVYFGILFAEEIVAFFLQWMRT